MQLVRSLKPIRLVALAALLATAACTEIKETTNAATAKLDSWLGVESSTESGATEDSERLYQEGLAARQLGAEEDAFATLLEAAELGHGAAAYEVGLAYRDGRGTAEDLDASAKWINSAADRGEPRAQYLVGLAYYSGTGVEQDYAHAAKFLTAAAAQGHAEAQLLLGKAFANGRGVAKNRAWAARWYGKAAAQGLAEAQFTYGVVHASGLGLPKNPERGYAWLLLAARAGHEQAKEVTTALEGKLSAEQIARATAKADRFRPVAEPPFADPPTVMYLQQALNGLGFDAGPVDGISGKRTRGAINKYQESRGLPASGEPDPELLQRLLDDQSAGA